MDGQVTFQRRCAQHGALPRRPVVEPPTEGGQVFLPHREARRHGVAAEAEQDVGAGGDALVQVEALHAAAAALALAVLIHRHHDDRASCLFHEAGGHDADDAGVPVPAPEQDDPVLEALRLSIQQLLRGPDDLHLGLLPLAVDVGQLMGQLLGPVFVLAEHQLQGCDGAVHPARRVDAGSDGIADVLRRHRPARKPHLFQQGAEAGPVGVLELAQTGFDDGAVLAGQGHNVGHRAHSGEVAAVFQHLLRWASVQRSAELEGHARAAQALEGAVVVCPAGIYDGHRLRQALVGQMVVGDDEVDAETGRKGGFLHRRDAVVHRDDEAASLIIDGLDGVLRQAVAVALPAGQHTLGAGPHPFEVLIEQGGGGHAVHIVVAEDHDGLALVDGSQDARAGLVHVGQEHGVAQLLLARQQCQRLGGVGDAPGSEDAGQQTGLLLLGRKDRAVFLLAPRPIVHALVFQLFGVLLGDGGGQLL